MKFISSLFAHCKPEAWGGTSELTLFMPSIAYSSCWLLQLLDVYQLNQIGGHGIAVHIISIPKSLLEHMLWLPQHVPLAKVHTEPIWPNAV